MIDGLPLGRMIAPSKSDYYMAHPDHVVVFNANICTRTQGTIWQGDLDLTVDGEALKAMAAEQGDELYIFRESRDGTDWDAAVARVTADILTLVKRVQ